MLGTGTINANVVNGGTINPGLSPGIITINGNYTQGDGALNIEIGGTTVGTQYDQLNVMGTVTLAGALGVDLINAFVPVQPQTFTIINNDGNDPVSGTFAGLAQGATFVGDGAFFTISYTGGDGNDVVLSALDVMANPLIVTTTADTVDANDSLTSLREAINFSNTNPGTDTITFNIPGTGVQTINVGSTALGDLPTISQPVIIDGYTQPGATANMLAVGNNAMLLVELNGTAALNGLTITGGNSTVRGLVINRFNSGHGLLLQTLGGNTITGNFIGTNAAGTAALGTGVRGATITSTGNQIGGTTPEARNVIAIGYGIQIAASNNTIQGNYLGTNAAGTARLTVIGNSGFGVSIEQGAGFMIGGTQPGAGNVIAGFAEGIRGVFVTGSFVQGNYIGTNSAGAAGLGNGLGINLLGNHSPNINTIGGTATGAGNVISGNTGIGVVLSTGTSSDIRVQGNLIGLAPDGTTPLGNGGNGVEITTGNNNTVGGLADGAGNRIAFNGGDGVFVSTGAGNAILRNSIFSNTGLGIDLGANGPAANDNLDPDAGANNLQNFPVLTGLDATTTSTTVQGSLNSTASTSFRIEVFASDEHDSSHFGEGQTFLGFTTVTTNASGNASFSFTAMGNFLGQSISTTATNNATNDTSEFSAACEAIDVVGMNFVVTNTLDTGVGSLRQAITNANGNLGTDTITFCIPGTGVQTIAPTFPGLPPIFSPVIIDGYTQPGATENTQAVGDNAMLLIELSGASAGDNVTGLDFRTGSGGSIIRGLVVNRFSNTGINITENNVMVLGNFIGTNPAGTMALGTGGGIRTTGGFGGAGGGNQIGTPAHADRNLVAGGIFLQNATNATNIVQNNYIGVDKSGNVDVGSGSQGIQINGVFNGTTQGATLIGGATPTPGTGAGNVISGNTSAGIRINVLSGSTNVLGPVTIQGNLIGLGVDGTTAVGNGGSGIDYISDVASTSAVLIGGADATLRNIISGNGTSGILYASTNTTVQGNFIGTDITGTLDRGNTARGIEVVGDHRSSDPALTTITIGGTATGAGNLISGNNSNGISVRNGISTIQGNFIGTQVNGTSALGNSGEGISIITFGNPVTGSIGGAAAGAGNTIAHNTGAGVSIGATTVTILRNSMFSNGNFGIDLSGGFLNDNGDVDTGPNNLLNFPVLTTATISGGNVILEGFARPASNIELFIAAPDPSGFGEGRTFLALLVEGSAGDQDAAAGTYGPGLINGLNQGTDTTNRFRFTFPTPAGVAPGSVLTSTATDSSGNTSEFSGNVTVQAAAAADTDLAVTKSDSQDPVLAGNNLTYTITVNNNGGDAAFVNLIDLLPVGTTLVSFMAQQPGWTTSSQQPGTVSASSDLLPAGRTATFTLIVNVNASVDAGTMIVNTVNVSSETTDTNPNNNADTEETHVCNFVVTNANDSGPGSLREVIICANEVPGLNTITFAIPAADTRHFYYTNDGMAGQVTLTNVTMTNAAIDAALVNPDPDFARSWWSIRPNSVLPTVTGAVIIDGTSQPGFAGTPIIELDGSGTSFVNGLNIAAPASTVRSLVINRFGGANSALELTSGAGHTVQGSYVGTDVSGTLIPGNNSIVGIDVRSSENLIGGTGPGQGNLISGNEVGIQIATGDRNRVEGNLIGTDITGTRDRGNSAEGVFIRGTDNVIGGTAAVARNVISGNGFAGIHFFQSGPNRVQGNYIGTDTSGLVARGNDLQGVAISTSNGNQIGGGSPVVRNIIAGNKAEGIRFDVEASNNVIQGNYLGVGQDGVDELGKHPGGRLPSPPSPLTCLPATGSAAPTLARGTSSPTTRPESWCVPRPPTPLTPIPSSATRSLQTWAWGSTSKIMALRPMTLVTRTPAPTTCRTIR